MKRRGFLGLAAAALAFVVSPFRVKAAESHGRVTINAGKDRLDLIVEDCNPKDLAWMGVADDILARHHPEGDLHGIKVAFVYKCRAYAPENPFFSRCVEMFRNGNYHPWQAVVGSAYGEYSWRLKEANPTYEKDERAKLAMLIHVWTLPPSDDRHYEGLSVRDPDGSVRSYLSVW